MTLTDTDTQTFEEHCFKDSWKQTNNKKVLNIFLIGGKGKNYMYRKCIKKVNNYIRRERDRSMS